MKLHALVFVTIISGCLIAPNVFSADSGKLRHVVVFKYKASATEAQILKVEKAFRDLQNKIPIIQDFESGVNNSPEGLNKGLTHCFILTFGSKEDRDTYLVHPDHKAFGKVLAPIKEDVFVVDFWAK
jgi:hypothetical protein